MATLAAPKSGVYGPDPLARASALAALVDVLRDEGVALAKLDLDAIEAAAEKKQSLLDQVERALASPLKATPAADAERLRSLTLEARSLNNANAKLVARLGSSMNALGQPFGFNAARTYGAGGVFGR